MHAARVAPTPFPTAEQLRELLAPRPHPEAVGARVEAAVAVCLLGGAVLLARRAHHPLDPWSGHAALPGGRMDAGDPDLLETALRETREEVGFDPLEHGRLLGALGSYTGEGRSRIAGVRVSVFVCELDREPVIELSSELDEAHWVPLSALQTTSVGVPELDEAVDAYELAVGERPLIVWGITYRILEWLRSVA